MMSLITRISSSNRTPRAFTLIELVIVMLIISAMLTMLMPYAARSDRNLTLRQHALSIAEAVRYAVTLAEKNNTPARFLIDAKSKSWLIQTADPLHPGLFLNAVNTQFLSENINILDTDGFTLEAAAWCLLFDPSRPWPAARLALGSPDAVQTITIQGKRIEIEESQI